MPASVVNNRIGHGAAAITPTRTDPTPGLRSAPAIRDTWLDGTWVYPLPLDASQLSLGTHTWTLVVTDNAGNGNKVTYTFLVTTSFADIDALLTRYGTAGRSRPPRSPRCARRWPRPRRPATPATRPLRSPVWRPSSPRSAPASPTRRRATCSSPTPRTSSARCGASRTRPRPPILGTTSQRLRGPAASPVRRARPGRAQREPEVQGARDRQPHARLPPPGDRGRDGDDPGARRAAGLRRRPLGSAVPGASRFRTRRSRAPPTSPSTRSSSATRRSATSRSTPRTR